MCSLPSIPYAWWGRGSRERKHHTLACIHWHARVQVRKSNCKICGYSSINKYAHEYMPLHQLENALQFKLQKHTPKHAPVSRQRWCHLWKERRPHAGKHTASVRSSVWRACDESCTQACRVTDREERTLQRGQERALPTCGQTGGLKG